MVVGHSKFRLGEGFGSIRQHIHHECNVMCMKEVQHCLGDSSVSNKCTIFYVGDVRDWKSVLSIFIHFPK